LIAALADALQPAGISPPQADLLSCSCKKVGKEHGPDCARPYAFGFRVPCAAQNPGAAQNSRRSLRSLWSDKLREPDHVSRLRREPLGSSAARRRRGAGSNTLVVFHGLLPHYSAANRSAISRHVDTLHVTDASSSYSAAN
jgi:hypothetical protein